MDTATVVTALQGGYAVLVGSRGQGSTAGLVATVTGLQRLRNVIDACEAEAMGQLGAIEVLTGPDGVDVEHHHGVGHQEMGAPELVAPCLGVSVQVASARMLSAVHQLTSMPALVEEMAAGRLDGYRARVITDELADAPVATAAAVVAELCAHAHTTGGWHETPGPLRRRVVSVLARIDEAVLAARVVHERAGRGLTRRVESSGMDRWEGFYPVQDARLAWEAIDVIARRLLSEGSADNLYQARADAHLQLLLGQVNATIHLHPTHPAHTGPAQAGPARAATPAVESEAAPETTGEAAPAEAAPAPAEPSTAPAPAACTPAPARHSASALPVGVGGLMPLGGFAGLRSVLVPRDWVEQARGAGRVVPGEPVTCHRETGAALALPAALADADTSRTRAAAGGVQEQYRPTARLRALIQLRDGACRFPGCQVRARFCDLDHVTSWPAGPTSPDSLICLCRRHHRLKQQPHWRVRLAPDGIVTWSYPDGHILNTDPVDHLAPTRPLHTTTARDRATATARDRATATATVGEDAAASPPSAKVQYVPDTPYDLGEDSPLLEHLTRTLRDHRPPGRRPSGRRPSRKERDHLAARHWREHLTTTPVPTHTHAGLTISTHTRRETLHLPGLTPRAETITYLWSYDEPPF